MPCQEVAWEPLVAIDRSKPDRHRRATASWRHTTLDGCSYQQVDWVMQAGYPPSNESESPAARHGRRMEGNAGSPSRAIAKLVSECWRCQGTRSDYEFKERA